MLKKKSKIKINEKGMYDFFYLYFFKKCDYEFIILRLIFFCVFVCI